MEKNGLQYVYLPKRKVKMNKMHLFENMCLLNKFGSNQTLTTTSLLLPPPTWCSHNSHNHHHHPKLNNHHKHLSQVLIVHFFKRYRIWRFCVQRVCLRSTNTWPFDMHHMSLKSTNTCQRSILTFWMNEYIKHVYTMIYIWNSTKPLFYLINLWNN